MAGIHDDLVFRNDISVVVNFILKRTIVAELKDETGVSDTWFFLSGKKLVEKSVILVFFWIFID